MRVGEGKNVRWEKERRGGLSVARWLREAVIEAASARAGNVSEDTVDGDTAVLVGVESLIEEVAKKAAVLRNAFNEDAGNRSNSLWIVFRVGSEIAKDSEGESGNDGIGNDVHVFVDFSGFETAFEMDGAIVGDEPTFDCFGELPFAARDGGALRSWGVANGECVARVARIGNRIFGTADVALN